jgi:hypothetical protein
LTPFHTFPLLPKPSPARNPENSSKELSLIHKRFADIVLFNWFPKTINGRVTQFLN